VCIIFVTWMEFAEGFSDDRREDCETFLGEIRRWRPGKIVDPRSACRRTLCLLARRWGQLDEEIRSYDSELKRLTLETCPELLERTGVGPDVASSLLVAAGDNPERLNSEASFAALCSVSPLDASSGRQRRHRLNRGGNREAYRALWVVAFTRLRTDPRTKAYAERRTQEGFSRCLQGGAACQEDDPRRSWF
jgi:transposase